MDEATDVLADLRLVHYTDERVADPRAATADLSWQAYHTARNAVVRACSRHGSTGPMGERPIGDDEDASDDSWPVGDSDAALYVLDDQLNRERYVYLEVTDPAVIGRPLLADLIVTLRTLPAGWGVGVNSIRDGYLLLFASFVLAHGPAFERASDLDQVIRVWREAVTAG